MNWFLKQKIIERYGSQFEFAKAVGIHESELSRIIRGRRQVDENTRKKWADVLNCNFEQLFPSQKIEQGGM